MERIGQQLPHRRTDAYGILSTHRLVVRLEHGVVRFHDWYVLKLFPNPQLCSQAPLGDVPFAPGMLAVQHDFGLYVSRIHHISYRRMYCSALLLTVVGSELFSGLRPGFFTVLSFPSCRLLVSSPSSSSSSEFFRFGCCSFSS